MKLTRRTFIKLAGAAGVAGSVGCGDAAEADLEPTEEFDSPPDEMLDAGTDDLDAGADDLDAGAGDLDAAVEEDAATGTDSGAPGLDASTDAGADVPVTPPRDVPVTPPRDVPVTPPRVDAGRDAGPAPLAHPDFRDLPERRTQFPLGVMAGDATDTSVMFWTKYSGDAPVVLRVLEMDGNRIAAVRFNGRVTPSGEGFVRAVVTGLRPNRRHLYAFLLGGATSPSGRSLIGRVQTAIGADSLAPIVFGGTSCSSPRAHPFPVLQDAGSRDDLDFFIHAGDHIYADLLGPAATTISQYRAKYSEAWSSSGMRALHGSTGQYLTWDDHEVFNNWNPESVSPGRLAAARQAFFEHRATRRSADDRDRIWRSFRWGRTAEVFILDCRGERRPSTRSEDPSRSSTYISRRQMDWLKAGLRASPCVFKFIVNSVPIVDRAGADGDNWNGYASQRREILNHIDNNRLRGVVWLSGDVHFGGVCRVEAAGPWSDIWEVVMGPSGSNRDGRPPIRPAQWPVLVHDVHNYVLFHADPASRTLTVDFINADGNRIPDSRWTHTF